MRNNIFVFLICGLMLSAGCSDFLDLKPKGRDIPETIEHYDGLFNNNTLTSITYAKAADGGTGGGMQFTQLGNSSVYFIFMSDELFASTDSEALMSYSIKEAFAWRPDMFDEEYDVCEWATLYMQIYAYNIIANEVLDAAGGTAEKKLQLQAEARASRALRYMWLAQFFGKPYNEATAATELCVPLVTEADMNQTALTRNTVKEVYDFIITELEECCPQLPENTYNHLRISQCAGWFMLGKAYWFKGDYENARIALAKAVELSAKNSIGLTLYDYNTAIATWGWNAAQPHRWTMGFPASETGANKEVIYNYQYILNDMLHSTTPKAFVKPEYMAIYGATDQRLKFFSDKTSNAAGNTLDGTRRLATRGKFSLGAEMPDLHLMLIESQARSADAAVQAEARTNLVEFRKLRMPAEDAAIPAGIDTQDKLIRFVVEERLREYMMTGQRWFDVRRLWNDPLFQDMKTNYTHTDGTQTYTLTEDRLVYRIPPKVYAFHPEWENNK